jgi:hypothetical protein
MQAIFTKLAIGFLLLTLVVGTGLTFLISTANLNGFTADDVITNNDIAVQSQAARNIVYESADASKASGLDGGDTDLAQAKDSINTGDTQIKISTVVTSFMGDLASIVPISQFVINIILAIIAVIGVSATIYLLLGRNV